MPTLKPLELGCIFWAQNDKPALDQIRALKALGLRCAQMGCSGEFQIEGKAAEWKAAAEAEDFALLAIVAAYDGEDYADIPTVERTVGFIPPATRQVREARTLALSDFGKALDVEIFACHVGFVPHDKNDANYIAVREMVRRIADHCAGNSQYFHLETGQEPAEVLLEFLADTRLRFTLSAALACGVALISIAYFVDDSLALQLVRNSPFGDPNLLLLKATTNDRPGLEQLLADPSYGVKRWRIIPFVRLASRNGKPGLWLVTCATGLGNQVRVDRRLLRQMQLKPGDTLRLGLGNGELAGPIQEATQLSPLSRFWEGVVVDCARFPYADAFWNGGAWIDPARIPALEAQLAPGVIPVRMNEVEEIVAESGRNAVVLLDVSALGSLLITFLLTSLLVKMAADRRQREIAVLRALGATSATIIRRLAKEFARDAFLAAMAGVALGTLVTFCVMRYLTGDWPAPPSLAACLAITVGAAALSTGLAVLSCRPYWRCRPMDILRRVSGADLC